MTTLRDIIADMLAYEADQFDGSPDVDLQVSGADLVDAFTYWRQQLKAEIEPKSFDGAAYAYDVQARVLIDRETRQVIASNVSGEHAACLMFAPNMRAAADLMASESIAGAKWEAALNALLDALDLIDVYELQGSKSDAEIKALESAPSTSLLLSEALAFEAYAFDAAESWRVMTKSPEGNVIMEADDLSTAAEAEAARDQTVSRLPAGWQAWCECESAYAEVNGADLVEWFAEWRERARQALAGQPIKGERLMYNPATREIQDENGFTVAKDVLPADAARIVAAAR